MLNLVFMKRILGLSTATISKNTGIPVASLNSYFRIKNDHGRNKMSCNTFNILYDYLSNEMLLIPFEHVQALSSINTHLIENKRK